MKSSIGWGAGALLCVAFAAAGARHGSAQPADACPDQNTGIVLSPGFCATVFADGLGHARHMAVAQDGTVYVNTWSGRYFHGAGAPKGGFLLALKDTRGTGRADKVERFGPTQAEGSAGGTGIALYKGGLYAEMNDKVVRFALPADGSAPTGTPETVLSGMPLTGDHPMHPFVIDPHGHLYIDIGSATNSCQEDNRIANSLGLDPCHELETRAGTWLYDANKTGQQFSPRQRYATGIRNGEGYAFDASGQLYVTQHGRDQLGQNWSRFYNVQQGANLPAEEVVKLQDGGDYGWPECYFDNERRSLMLAPEYGGDGKTVGVCAKKLGPAAFFPAHWAPNDMVFSASSAFPRFYQGGVFIAFHGSWNRAPAPQGGYNVVYQPFVGGKASGDFLVFADGFAGATKEPGRAAHRPTGLAMGPDGALYIADDVKGRIWRVTYRGGSQPASVSSVSAMGVPNGSSPEHPPEGTHPDAGRPVAALPTPPGASADQVALGNRIFHGEVADGTCSGCHGSDGMGSTVGPDLTSGKWVWGDGSLAAISHTIESGVAKPKTYTGVMPPKGGAALSDADVKAVAAYVWALGHAKS